MVSELASAKLWQVHWSAETTLECWRGRGEERLGSVLRRSAGAWGQRSKTHYGREVK